MGTLIGWLSRGAQSGLRALAAGAVALALAVALLAGVTAGPLAQVGNVLAAGGTTYASCPDAIAAFPTDLAGVISGSATFTFPDNCTITLSGALTIGAGADITINGNGLTLVGKDASTDVIDMPGTTSSSSTLFLNDVTVKGGRVGINAGGSDGIVDSTGGGGDGGDGGMITLVDSTISGNASNGISAGGGNGIKYGYGADGGTIILASSTISDNGGDGIDVSGGKGGQGDGAGDARGAGSGGSVTLTDSTISGSGSDGIAANGGTGGSTDEGSRGGYGGSGGTVKLTNSTITGGASDGISAIGGTGGSAFTTGGSGGAGGMVTLTSSTISGDVGDGISAIGGSGGDNDNGVGGTLGDGGAVNLTATILANTGANCAGIGSLADLGYNLSTDTTCDLGEASQQGSAVTSGLNLLPLGNYGGPTQTVALGANSIAIDQIPAGTTVTVGGTSTTICPATADGSVTDQRGVPRPQGLECDIGAYELIQGSYTQTESTCPTQAQLQDDLDLANSLSGKLLTINLPPNCTIDLTSSLEVDAGADITLNGNGLVLKGNGTTTAPGYFDIIDIHGEGPVSTLNLDRTTIENGRNGLADLGARTSTVNLTASTISGNADSGIEVAGVNLFNSTISGNGANGVSATTATLTRSTVSGNGGNGIFATTVTVINSTVSGGQGSTGIWALGNATLTNSTIGGNGTNGIIVDGSATVTASILAGYGQNCAFGTLAGDDYNLSTDTSCGFSNLTSHQGSTVASSLNLLPLGNYGGPTETIALGPGSIAIDAIPATACASIIDPSTQQPIATDQRGIARPQGPACDIGAYEAPALKLSADGTQGNNGYYTSAVSLSLAYSGLAPSETLACTGTSFTGLPVNADALNQSGTASASLTSDGSHTSACTISVIQDTSTVNLGYSATGLPVTIKIDTTKPTISITSPTDGATYALHQAVDAAYSCSDPAPGAGLAACIGTVANGQLIDTGAPGSHTFTVNATDNAGNTNTKSVSYTVGYQLIALPGNTTTVNHGYFALIRFAPEDANGHDVARRNLKVTSIELDGPGGQTIPFVHQFQFTMAHHTPQYQLELNTRNLSSGAWTLRVQIGTGSSATTGTITFTVK